MLESGTSARGDFEIGRCISVNKFLQLQHQPYRAFDFCHT